MLDPWPAHMDALWPAIKSIGYERIEPLGANTRNKHCVILKPKSVPMASCAVAMCIDKPWSKLSKVDKLKTANYMKAISKPTAKKLHTQTPVLAVVLAPSHLGAWHVAWIKKSVVD